MPLLPLRRRVLFVETKLIMVQVTDVSFEYVCYTKICRLNLFLNEKLILIQNNSFLFNAGHYCLADY